MHMILWTKTKKIFFSFMFWLLKAENGKQENNADGNTEKRRTNKRTETFKKKRTIAIRGGWPIISIINRAHTTRTNRATQGESWR